MSGWIRRVAAAVATLMLLSGVAVGASDEHPALAFADRYREVLEAVAGGSLATAVGLVATLEEESSAGCVRAIELQAATELAKVEPEAPFGVCLLRLAVHQELHLLRRSSFALTSAERTSIGGLRDLADLYLTTSPDPRAPSRAAGLLTYLAQVVSASRTTERMEVAWALLEGALELDSQHRAALHSMVVNLELRSRPGLALSLVDRLLELEPEDPLLLLRRALLTLERGDLEQGLELLEELRSSPAPWVRDLATQELARLLVEEGREDEAKDVLRQGLRELPTEKLSLQLAALLDPDWGQSSDVLAAWLDTHQADAGPSGRWLYERGLEKEIQPLREALGSALSPSASRLQEALPRLREPALGIRHFRSACR